jgi:O-antigen/teichoic acid export membrane protein
MKSSVGGIKGLFRSALEVLAGRAAVAIASLLFLAYFAREMPKELFGLMALHAALAAASAVILNLGLHYAVIKKAAPAFARDRCADAVNEIIGPASVIRLAATIVFVTLFLVLAVSYPPGIAGVNMWLAIPCIAIHLLFKNCQHILTPVFHARQQYLQSSFMDSASALAEKVGAFSLYSMLGFDYFFAGFMLGQSVVTVASFCMLFPVLRQGKPGLWNWRAARPWSYRVQYIRVLSRDGFQQLDRLLVGAIFPLAELGYYHLARQLAATLKVLIRAMADPLTVRLAYALTSAQLYRDRYRYLLIGVALPLAMAASSPAIIVTVGGESFAPATMLLSLMALSYLFYAPSEYHLAVLNIRGHQNMPVKFEIFAALTGIIVTLVMANAVGLEGVPFGQFTAFCLMWLGGRTLAKNILTDTPAHRPSAGLSMDPDAATEGRPAS